MPPFPRSVIHSTLSISTDEAFVYIQIAIMSSHYHFFKNEEWTAPNPPFSSAPCDHGSIHFLGEHGEKGAIKSNEKLDLELVIMIRL